MVWWFNLLIVRWNRSFLVWGGFQENYSFLCWKITPHILIIISCSPTVFIKEKKASFRNFQNLRICLWGLVGGRGVRKAGINHQCFLFFCSWPLLHIVIIILAGLEIHKESESNSLHTLILQTFSKNSIKDCNKLCVVGFLSSYFCFIN